jgi:EamA-like transporter family
MNVKEPTISSEIPNRSLVIAAFLIVYLIWGSTYLGIRLAIESIPPLFMAGTRNLVAGGAMFLFALVRSAKLPSKAEWRSAFIVGGCLLLGGRWERWIDPRRTIRPFRDGSASGGDGPYLSHDICVAAESLYSKRAARPSAAIVSVGSTGLNRRSTKKHASVAGW